MGDVLEGTDTETAASSSMAQQSSSLSTDEVTEEGIGESAPLLDRTNGKYFHQYSCAVRANV